MKKWYVLMAAALLCLSGSVVATAESGNVDSVAAEAVTLEAATTEATPTPTPAAPSAIQELEAVDTAPGSTLEGKAETEIELASSSGGITCTFNCNNGTGLLYDCPESGLGACCAAAQPACASHGGLASGICSQGRLGLPCIPL